MAGLLSLFCVSELRWVDVSGAVFMLDKPDVFFARAPALINNSVRAAAHRLNILLRMSTGATCSFTAKLRELRSPPWSGRSTGAGAAAGHRIAFQFTVKAGPDSVGE